MRGTIPILIPLLAASITLAAPAQAMSNQDWSTSSRVGEVALVAAALGLPSLKADWKGTLQAGESIGAAFALTEGLKEAFPEYRPDRSDRRSFPSGHTSVSFAAAATLQNRYGWEIGIPATLVATFVGVARIKAEKHHWYDVVAGAAIGEASGFLLTSRHNSNVKVFPWGDTKEAGISVAMRF